MSIIKKHWPPVSLCNLLLHDYVDTVCWSHDSSLFFPYIADISHKRHNRWWCTFFKTVYFLALRMQCFGLLWPVLTKFLQAKLVWWCSNIGKYQVCVHVLRVQCSHMIFQSWSGSLMSRAYCTTSKIKDQRSHKRSISIQYQYQYQYQYEPNRACSIVHRGYL